MSSKKLKTTTVIIIVIAVVTVVCFIAFPFHASSSFSLQNDTLLAKQYTDSAELLLQSKPDSAILLYKKAIERLESIPSDKKIRHLLANTYVDLSNVYLLKSKYDETKKLCLQALKIAGKTDKDIKAKVLMQDGLTCYNQGEYNEALKLYEQASILAKQTNNRKLLTKLFSNKAIISYSQGNVKTATADFIKTLQLAKELNDPALISDAYVNLGMVYTDKMDYERAKVCYATAIEYYKKNKQHDDLIICYRNLGNVYYMIEKYPEAIDWYQKSLELAIALDNKKGMAKAYHNTGEVYMLIGDYVQANKVFILSLKLKESIDDKAGMASGYRSLGNLYFVQKDFNKSLFYHQKALEIDNNLQLIKGQAKDYANLSTVYAELKQLPKAIVYCSKALKLARQVDDKYGIAEYMRTLGSLYYLKNDYVLAELYYKKAITQKLMLFDQEGLTSVYNQMAELYADKPASATEREKNLQTALGYALKAWNIAEQQKIPRLISYVSKNISEIYKKLNNYPKAYKFLEINKLTDDSIFDRSKTEALTFAEARWNNEKKQQQIASLKKLNTAISAQKLAEEKHYKTIVLGLILIFILGAIAVGLFWMYRDKQREMTHREQLSSISLLRLQIIRNRISPHFIFNILNREICSEQDKEKHREMFGLLNFLRRSLEITEQNSVTLDEELDFVKNYLQMEQSGLGEEFQIKWEIDKNLNIELFRIPAMMIQIPVENALKHALRAKKGEKLLQISITQSQNRMHISIQDNGDGYHPEAIVNTRGTGTGLKVLYQTIDVLNSRNNEKINFTIADVEHKTMSGTKVDISIPEGFNFEL